RDPKVAMQRQLESAGERRALDSRDRWHRETLQSAEDGLERGRVVTAAGLGHFLQIDPRAKACSFAAQEQRTDFAVALELDERIVERLDHRLIEGVALFGTVQRQDRVIWMACDF